MTDLSKREIRRAIEKLGADDHSSDASLEMSEDEGEMLDEVIEDGLSDLSPEEEARVAELIESIESGESGVESSSEGSSNITGPEKQLMNLLFKRDGGVHR